MFDFKKAESKFKKSARLNLLEERLVEFKKIYPELNHWKNQSIDKLWSQYSLAIYMTKDASWLKNRKESLLAYIYVVNKYPEFNFGTQGMFEDYLEDFAKKKPWLNEIEEPKWIKYSFLTE